MIVGFGEGVSEAERRRVLRRIGAGGSISARSVLLDPRVAATGSMTFRLAEL